MRLCLLRTETFTDELDMFHLRLMVPLITLLFLEVTWTKPEGYVERTANDQTDDGASQETSSAPPTQKPTETAAPPPEPQTTATTKV